jgi:23S rRNA pseudouridine2605 synthase
MLIRQGRVAVNGFTITELGTRVKNSDRVFLDGKEVKMEQNFHYLALNKPSGYLCSSRDPRGRPLALDLLPNSITERLYNVGRLDYLSSGLIFFTNDGDFTARLSHPGSGIEKEYYVESTVPVPDLFIKEFLEGIMTAGEHYRARNIIRLGRKTLRIILVEGKNREIRKVFSHFHLHPSLLRRIRIGDVELGNLPEGQCRPLSINEIAGLQHDHRN